MRGSLAITTFAFAAIPGVLVLEILEFGKPRLRERLGVRAIALFLIVSAIVWSLAVVLFGADQNLAAVIESPIVAVMPVSPLTLRSPGGSLQRPSDSVSPIGLRSGLSSVLPPGSNESGRQTGSRSAASLAMR